MVQKASQNFSKAFPISAYTNPVAAHDAVLVYLDVGTYGAPGRPTADGQLGHNAVTGAAEISFFDTTFPEYNQNMVANAGVTAATLTLHFSSGTTGSSVSGAPTNTQVLPYRIKSAGGITGVALFGLQI